MFPAEVSTSFLSAQHPTGEVRDTLHREGGGPLPSGNAQGRGNQTEMQS